MRLIRATMKIPIWIRSEYVTYIGITLLSRVWRGSPSGVREGRPPVDVL